MKKSALLIILTVLCAMLLTGCFCRHEVWKNADCENPKTCAECGKTEGEPLGHNWADATCDAPKTCQRCSLTEGEALGHDWVDATCDAPKTCQRCSLTEGEALGHNWLDATTEAPQTCAVCAKTEGERIITDERFTTAACSPFFGKWVLSIPFTGDMMGLEGFTEVLNVDLHLEFTNDGKSYMSVTINNADDFNVALKAYMVDLLYAEFEAQGIGKEDADKAILEEYDMTMEELADTFIQSLDITAMFEEIGIEGNYYVEGNNLYMGETWSDSMNPNSFRFEGETLILEGLTEAMGISEGGFTRIPEAEE